MILRFTILTVIGVGFFFYPVVQLHQRGDLRVVLWQCATVLVYGTLILLFYRARKR